MRVERLGSSYAVCALEPGSLEDRDVPSDKSVDLMSPADGWSCEGGSRGEGCLEIKLRRAPVLPPLWGAATAVGPRDDTAFLWWCPP